MADVPDVTYKAPPSPKKDLPAQAKAKGDLSFSTWRGGVVEPSEGDYHKPREGYLDRGTRGPISNEADVTRQVRASVDRDLDMRAADDRKATERSNRRTAKPVTLGRKVSR